MCEVFRSECEKISIVCVRLIFSSMCVRFNFQLCVCEVFSSECESISVVCVQGQMFSVVCARG